VVVAIGAANGKDGFRPPMASTSPVGEGTREMPRLWPASFVSCYHLSALNTVADLHL
jgi:hypothetical protein